MPRRLAPLAPLVLLSGLLAPACSTPQLPEVPLPLATCEAEPAFPASLKMDSDLTDWILDLRAAGADCRSKLQHVVESVQ